MSLFDVLSGRLPLFKSDQIEQYVVDIEKEFDVLINSTRPGFNSQVRFPSAPASVVAADQQAAIDPQNKIGARYTINSQNPTKIADTQGERRRLFITVTQVGKTLYVSHNRLRLLNSPPGAREGIPITSAATGEPALSTLQWQGEMWAIAAQDQTVIDVEME